MGRPTEPDRAPPPRSITQLLRALVPEPLLRLRRRWLLRRLRADYRALSVGDAFARIYATNTWGGEHGQFCSGDGSGDSFAVAYAGQVNDFIERHGVQSVVDLGCGDFRVGRRIARPGVHYIGVDVVAEMVSDNQARFGDDGVRFECRDITADALPDAQLCLIRQVLQHLSNAEIGKVLTNVSKYPHVLVTEHLPAAGTDRPNVDKPHGPDIRLYDGSGVYLDRPPFSRPVETLFEVACGGDPPGVLRTVLLRNPAPTIGPTR